MIVFSGNQPPRARLCRTRKGRWARTRRRGSGPALALTVLRPGVSTNRTTPEGSAERACCGTSVAVSRSHRAHAAHAHSMDRPQAGRRTGRVAPRGCKRCWVGRSSGAWQSHSRGTANRTINNHANYGRICRTMTTARSTTTTTTGRRTLVTSQPEHRHPPPPDDCCAQRGVYLVY